MTHFLHFINAKEPSDFARRIQSVYPAVAKCFSCCRLTVAKLLSPHAPSLNSADQLATFALAQSIRPFTRIQLALTCQLKCLLCSCFIRMTVPLNNYNKSFINIYQNSITKPVCMLNVSNASYLCGFSKYLRPIYRAHDI